MKFKRYLFLLAGGVSLFALLGLLWVTAPRLLTVEPLPGSSEVSVNAPLRLTFSRPLREEDVPRHLNLTPPRRGVFWWEGNTLIFEPTQPYPGGSTVTVNFTAGARAAGSLGLPLLRGLRWTFQTRQELITYLWRADSLADLYALNPATGEVAPLTETQNLIDFSLSPAQRSIFYSAAIPPDSSQIWRLDFPTSANSEAGAPPAELILDCPQADCRSVSPSPDGKWLAYERTPLTDAADPAPTQVWLLSLQDGQTRLAGDAQHTTLHPAWSARGWLSFYDNERQGYIVQDVSGNELSFLPNKLGEPGVWHPHQPVFIASEALDNVFSRLWPLATNHLIGYELDETGALLRRWDLSREQELDDLTPAFSPDGTRLAFARQYQDNQRWTPGKQLWVSNLDGSQAASLTQAPFYNHYDFAWNPDGQRLAFVRFNQDRLTDPPELWVINADGSNPVELVKGGYAPQWIP